MYYNGSMVMECTKVVVDASDPDWVVIRFMQDDDIIPKFNVSISPQSEKKFHFFNGIEGFEKTILLEQIDDSNTTKPTKTSKK